MPRILAAAVTCRAEFDCASSPAMKTSAFWDTASAIRNSRLRVLLPPKASPVRSSRLTRKSTPRSAERFGQDWRGVEEASRTRGSSRSRSRSSPAVMKGCPTRQTPAVPGRARCETRMPPNRSAPSAHPRAAARTAARSRPSHSGVPLYSDTLPDRPASRAGAEDRAAPQGRRPSPKGRRPSRGRRPEPTGSVRGCTPRMGEGPRGRRPYGGRRDATGIGHAVVCPTRRVPAARSPRGP